MNFKAILAATVFGTVATGAVAQNFDGVSFGVGVTNFGLSLEGEYAVNPQVGVRGMVMGGSVGTATPGVRRANHA